MNKSAVRPWKCVKIRKALTADADALASIHVRAWRESFAGLIPQRTLDALSAIELASVWRGILATSNISLNAAAFVAISNEGELLGFSCCGEQRSQCLLESGFDGEFMAIFVLKVAQRQGIGSRLMLEMVQELELRNIRKASLWVLRGHLSARSYYDSLEGTIVGQREVRYGGEIEDAELAYGWTDILTIKTCLKSRLSRHDYRDA